ISPLQLSFFALVVLISQESGLPLFDIAPALDMLTKKERGRNLLPCTKRGPEKAMRDTQEENAPIG
ncbi:MAG: hypothetical protein J6W10_01745, partial [Kiritimatiellae bacterium]|nr:hypothetical protein [Kiritimatiellia bacterium]